MNKSPLWALSVRQPWAELIILGFKDIEIRTWATKYRSRLLIHAGTTLDLPAVVRWFRRRKDVPTGAVVGSVKLVGVVRFTRKTWKEWGDRHLDNGRFPTDRNLYAWILEDPRPFTEPIPYLGALKLFRVNSPSVRRALTASLTQR